MEKRVADSPFKGLSGTVTIDQYRYAIDLLFENGSITEIKPGEGEQPYAMSISRDLFPAMCPGIPVKERAALYKAGYVFVYAKQGKQFAL